MLKLSSEFTCILSAALIIQLLLSGCLQAVEPDDESKLDAKSANPEGDGMDDSWPSGSVVEPVIVVGGRGSAMVDITAQGDWIFGLASIEYSVEGSGSTSFVIPFLEPFSSYAYEWRLLQNGTTHEGEFTTAQELEWFDGGNPISPGSLITIEDSQGCTLAFLARGPTLDVVYALTAGHCGDIGDSATVFFQNQDLRLGDFVLSRNDPLGFDFGVIEINESARPFLHPSVKEIGGPTGLPSMDERRSGEVVCFYGHGTGFSTSSMTQTRCGTIFMGWGQQNSSLTNPQFGEAEIWFYAPGYSGDSGAPVIHKESGNAMGIIQGGIGTLRTAHDICFFLDWTAAEGLPLRLFTSPLVGTPLLHHPGPDLDRDAQDSCIDHSQQPPREVE